MRLESALYTSQNGLEVHGAAISVVGDNLANVNTVGFKGSRAEFASMVSDGLEGGTSDTVPMPGNGVKVSSIREVKELGPIEPTGRALDVAIDGNGYFVVGSTTESFYTRAGNFTLDASGNLVTADGRNVLGYTVTNGTTSTSLGTINITNFNANPSATSSATLKGNLDASASITTAASNPASFKELNSAASFITTADVIDSLGETHTATLAFFKTAANTYTVQAYMDGGEISGGTEGTPSLISSGQLTFGSDGTIPDASKSQATLTLSPSYANGASAGNISLDLSGFTQYAAPSSIQAYTQDGAKAGQLDSLSVENTGEINANLNNGEHVTIAVIPIAVFANEDGLKRVGNNLYIATQTSGTASVDTPGSGTRGELKGGALERSSVDIAKEFTNVVLYQRGYQANSRIMNSVSQLITQTLNLVR